MEVGHPPSATGQIPGHSPRGPQRMLHGAFITFIQQGIVQSISFKGCDPVSFAGLLKQSLLSFVNTPRVLISTHIQASEMKVALLTKTTALLSPTPSPQLLISLHHTHFYIATYLHLQFTPHPDQTKLKFNTMSDSTYIDPFTQAFRSGRNTIAVDLDDVLANATHHQLQSESII